MTEGQVRAVLKEQAQPGAGWSGRRVKPTRRPALTLKDRLEAERLVGHLRVHAVFWFDPDGRLWSITETPLETDGPGEQGCAALEEALIAAHGEADLVTDTAELRHLIWRDESRKTRIHFRIEAGSECGIDYRELRGPLDR